MSIQVPFTAHIRVVPSRGTGKRFEYIRSMQKIAIEVYSQLENDSDLNLAWPGGGQFNSLKSASSGIKSGTAIKPQIGENPAQLMITGFLTSSGTNAPTHPDKAIIHSGTYQEGYGGSHGWSANPASATDTYASTLKTKINAAVTSASNVLTFSADWNIFKLEVAGVVYGDKGYTFP